MKTLKLTILTLLLVAFAQPLLAADYRHALTNVILPHEGGYQKIKSDWGNWTGCKPGKGILKGTKAGISACTYPGEDIRNLSAERIAFLYQRDFWDQYHLGECRLQTTADRLLDALVNNGPLAAKWLKKAINRSAHAKVVDDSTIRVTSYTIAQLNKQRQDRVLFWFAVYRGARYDTLADRFEEFVDTWADREIEEIITAVHDRDRLLEAQRVAKPLYVGPSSH